MENINDQINDQINALEERMYKSEYRNLITLPARADIESLRRSRISIPKKLMKRSKPSIGKISTTNFGNFERTTPKRLSK